MALYTRREMLAVLGYAGIGLTVLGTGCATTNGPIARARTDKPLLLLNDATRTQELISRLYSGDNPYAFANAQHIIEGLKGKYPSETEIAASTLEKRLRLTPGTRYTNGGDKPTDYASVGVTHNGPEDVHLLNEGQRLRLWLLLNALEDARYRKAVAAEIRRDFENKITELGGLELVADGMLRLHDVPGVDTRIPESSISIGGVKISQVFDSNNFYLMPKNTRETIPHAFGHHIHAALPYNAHHAGFSLTVHPVLPGGIGGDIGFAKIHLLPRYGEANEVIYTPLTREKEMPMRFNTGALFGLPGEKAGDAPAIVVINAGDRIEE